MKHLWILAILVTGSMLILSACSGATTIVFQNITECGTIRVELTNTETSATEVYDVPMSETVTIEVTANATYRFAVDYTIGEGPYECVEIRRGQVVVPPGASQKFNLTAVTPTPSTP